MVERLRRLMGRTEIRILVLLVCCILLAGLAVSIAQWTRAAFRFELPTVSSWDELVMEYLQFRDSAFPLVVPDECLPLGQLEAALDRYTLGELERQPGWYWNFDGGTLVFDADSELARQLGECAEIVVYEDMENGEILILRVPEKEGEAYREEIVYRAPEWREAEKGEDLERYLWRELSKRRIAWQVTLKTRKLAEEELAAAELEALSREPEEGEGGVLLRFGEEWTNIWLSVQGPNNGLTNVVIGIHVPDGFTNRVDIFTITNLLSFPWELVATIPMDDTTNSVYWADPLYDEFETCSYTAGNADVDSDGDGLPDAHERFLYGTDPHNWDTDGDGASDGDEIAAGTDPLNNPGDSDGDGLSDDLEIVLGTDPFSADTDGDWASDGYEVQQDTDPLDPLSTPEIRLLLNGNSVYAISTNLTVEIPGLIADYVIFSENADFQPSVTNVFVLPLSYSLLHDVNEWRNLYALPIRNSSETGSVIFGTILLDTEAPSLAITAPTNGGVTSRRWVRVEGLVGPSTSPLQVHINGLFADGVIKGTFYRSNLNLALGTNTIEVVASDAAGNATTQRVEIVQDFTGDTNAPQVQLDLPRDYEIIGGVTNWFDQTTFGEEEMLYIAGRIDDETAEVVFIVATEGATSAPVAGDVIGTQVWGRVSLHPGTNVLTVLASDAAGNVSTSAYTVIRETNFFFSITNPVAYQVVGSRTTLVSGVASPWLAAAAITVNGVEAQVTDHGTHVTFVTVEPILLNTRRTAVSAVAELNGKSYYADPSMYGYEGLMWRMDYELNAISAANPMNAGGRGFWSAESGVLTGCMYRIYGGPYGWETGSTNVWTVQTEPFRWGQGPFYSFNMGVEVFGAYMNEDYVWADRPWNGFGSDSLYYSWGGGIYHESASWDTEIRYIRNWPNPNERSVIFQFIDLDYGRKSYEGINPSAVTFLGATGMWYNGNVAFIVSLEPGAEYVMSMQDFTWPTYVDTRTGPDWGGLSFNFIGHWLTFSDFTNDVLDMEMTRPDEKATQRYFHQVFNDELPGICNVFCKTRITPDTQDVQDRLANKVSWSIDTIQGSSLSWQNGGISVYFGGEWEEKATFTGLPANNNEFGMKNVTVALPGGGSSQAGKAKIFYARDEKNHPGAGSGQTPNWYYYWQQGVIDDLDSFVYGGSQGDLRGRYDPNTDGLYIYFPAPEAKSAINVCHKFTNLCFDIGATAEGIYAVAATIAHERKHQWIHHNWTGFDSDGDGVPDSQEGIAPYFFDVDEPDTYNLADYWYGYASYGDQEFLARKAEDNPVNTSPEKDWAKPGQQWADGITSY